MITDSENEQINLHGIHIHPKNPNTDCDAISMIRIEPINLRRGAWRSGVLYNLRKIDPNIGVILFFSAFSAMLFCYYMRRFNSMIFASVYTVSSTSTLAVALSAAFGIDLLRALGALMN